MTLEYGNNKRELLRAPNNDPYAGFLPPAITAVIGYFRRMVRKYLWSADSPLSAPHTPHTTTYTQSMPRSHQLPRIRVSALHIM